MVFPAFHKVSAWISRTGPQRTHRVGRGSEDSSLFCLQIGGFNLPDIDRDTGTARGRAADCMVTNLPERVNEVIEHGRHEKSDQVTRVTVGKSQRVTGLVKGKLGRNAGRTADSG
jgi:hypothetical protein